MSMKFSMMAALLVGLPVGMITAHVPTAIAQEEVAPTLFRPQENPQEAMEREFFDHEKSILRRRDLGGASWSGHLIGILRYNDNGIVQDANSINRLHRYLKEQQTYGSSPTIRSVDLVSPFNTSVQMLPTQATNLPSDIVPSPIGQPMPMPMPAPGGMMPSAPDNEPPAPRQPVEAKF